MCAGNPGPRNHMGQGTQGPGTKPGTQKGRGPGPGPAHEHFWVPDLVPGPWVPWPIWSLAPGFPAHICKAATPRTCTQLRIHAPNPAYMHPIILHTCFQLRIHAPNRFIDMHPTPHTCTQFCIHAPNHTCTQPSYRRAPNSAYMHPAVL